MSDMRQGQNKTIGISSEWAYAFGCACGWGTFMMPGNIFLPEAGPLGSAIGIILASILMYFIVSSISYVANHYPNDSGIHVYIGKILGADHGFLSAWCVLLAYLSILWANVTAFIVLIRNLWGDVLQWGFYYEVAGYDVYFGEVLTTIVVIVFFGLLAIVGKVAVRLLHVFAALFQIGIIIVLFVGVLISGVHTPADSFGFALGTSPGVQVMNITMLAPWMFIGIEACTYMVNSGGRKASDTQSVRLFAIVASCLAYLLPVLMIVLALPTGFSNWMEYLDVSHKTDGLLGLPLFYSVYCVFGETGLRWLVFCILCGISTSLFGLYRVIARLLVTMSEEELLPEKVGRLNKNGEPYVAILIVMIISVIIPFFGRTAIGWVVDMTTISATIVYVYCMIGCLKLARTHKDAGRRFKLQTIIGMIFAAASFLFLLIPNVFSENELATESYLILAVWSIGGLVYYWYIYRRDKKRMYGKTTVMWMLMVFLVFFSSVMWIRQRTIDRIKEVEGWEGARLSNYVAQNALYQFLVVLVVLAVIFSLFSIMIARQKETDKKALESDARNRAKTEFLFHMSHDIRTPMNAILGFTDLALLDTGNQEKMEDYLKKIKSSGAHLLSLINDVLEMSRIESGKMEIASEVMDLHEVFRNLDFIVRGSAEAKGQTLTVTTENLQHPYVYGDRLRLNQVLLNLTSNAIKYTQEGGEIRVSIRETGDVSDGIAGYQIAVKDNGMGMTPEFAAKVFEAFEREKQVEKHGIQGTGLGMAITKRIVDLVGGSISVKTELEKGSEFLVDVSMPLASEADIEAHQETKNLSEVNFDGKRVLLTDDVEINREIAVAILEMFDLIVEQACDGQEALEKVVEHPAGYYDVVFLDIQMPRMNGYEAARAIRGLSDEAKAKVPIIAMTANAFEEDIKNAKAAGMNGHVAKPIDQEQLVEQLRISLQK